MINCYEDIGKEYNGEPIRGTYIGGTNFELSRYSIRLSGDLYQSRGIKVVVYVIPMDVMKKDK